MSQAGTIGAHSAPIPIAASPRVIIGCMLYNHAAEFREAIESILTAQVQPLP